MVCAGSASMAVVDPDVEPDTSDDELEYVSSSEFHEKRMAICCLL